ncbi:glycosyltransferase family 1 protein [Caballeronia sp. LZ065]|uniref:glycosyltransferase family 4 protein n=1 Tax=Caballeronia sp. LZ065 TaxID=3038571 RepID=UPI00286304F7|nr:glycosyltransferase family 1 protein [Caballeronia sp. LZ065]MDR5784462.1 glycosyltransferase family 1 protein [Caballeronia sp. LZ065]
MKIAMISEHASPLAIAGGVDSGGQNIYVANVARQLVRIGHNVDVFTRCDRSLLPLVSRFDNIRVINVPAGPPVQLPKEQLLPHMDAFARFMIGYMKHEAVPHDIVHANFFMSGLVGLRIKDALGVPLITTFHALGRVRRLHQGESDGFPDARFDIEDELVKRSDSVIAECPQDQNDLINLYDADPARIDLVPCGFDRAEFHPLDKARAREMLGWPQDRFIVLQLGRMVPRKGIDNVVRALGVCHAEHRESAELYVVGGNSDEANEIATPEIGRLRGIARECGIEEHVHFAGRHGRNDLKLFYNAADVFVTTPWYEPFGITPLEAMACGTPVIGADVGGIRYSVAHGETGLLVPPKHPAALAHAIATLKRDSALARRMGAAGLTRAQAMFTWSSVAQALAQVYERVSGPQLQDAARAAISGGSR